MKLFSFFLFFIFTLCVVGLTGVIAEDDKSFGYDNPNLPKLNSLKVEAVSSPIIPNGTSANSTLWWAGVQSFNTTQFFASASGILNILPDWLNSEYVPKTWWTGNPDQSLNLGDKYIYTARMVSPYTYLGLRTTPEFNFYLEKIDTGVYAFSPDEEDGTADIGYSGRGFWRDAYFIRNVYAGNFIGDGSLLTNLSTYNVTYDATTKSWNNNFSQLLKNNSNNNGFYNITNNGVIWVTGTNGIGTTNAPIVVNITGGAGGASNSGIAGAGSSIIISSGRGGTGTASGSGSTGGDILINTGAGGTGVGIAGKGGNINMTLGNGASASGSAGKGGSYTLISGSGNTAPGGGSAGGDIIMVSGVGGGGAGSGAGGIFSMTSGTGGYGTGGPGASGGIFTLTSGAGGFYNGTTLILSGGAGGNFILAGGVGGNSTTGRGGAGGSAYFNPGAGGIGNQTGTGNGSDGIVGICVNPTSGVKFGQVGIGTKSPTANYLVDINGPLFVRNITNLTANLYTQNITPQITNTASIGTNEKRYSNAWLSGLDIQGGTFMNGSLNITNNLYIMGNVSNLNPYAVFTDNTTQAMISTTVAQPINFSTTEDSYLISMVGKQNITVKQTGNNDYLFEVSALGICANNNKHINIWWQKNGVNVPRSNTLQELSTANVEALMTIPFIIDLNETDNLRIMWNSDSTGCQLQWYTNTSFIPETPSVILTITKISKDFP